MSYLIIPTTKLCTSPSWIGTDLNDILLNFWQNTRTKHSRVDKCHSIHTCCKLWIYVYWLLLHLHIEKFVFFCLAKVVNLVFRVFIQTSDAQHKLWAGTLCASSSVSSFISVGCLLPVTSHKCSLETSLLPVKFLCSDIITFYSVNAKGVFSVTHISLPVWPLSVLLLLFVFFSLCHMLYT